MVTNNTIFVEGGGQSKETLARCREGFHKLIDQIVPGRPPRIRACGSRRDTFEDFCVAHAGHNKAYVGMLVDSEDPVIDVERPWDHLQNRRDDNWQRPADATDDQVLLMTTCMETWIVSDHDMLIKHYNKTHPCLQQSALPALFEVELRHRHDIQDGLEKATTNCKNGFSKGKRSFEVLSVIRSQALLDIPAPGLPSFERAVRILTRALG